MCTNHHVLFVAFHSVFGPGFGQRALEKYIGVLTFIFPVCMVFIAAPSG